jgi:hypothetical protein
MQVCEIKNPRVLELLEHFRYLYRDKYDVTQTNNMIGSLESDSRYFTSCKYRDIIVEMGSDFRGDPETARSYPLKPNHYNGDDPEYRKDFERIDIALQTELGINSNALSQLYPPDGFIAWHNNANAVGYNLIFTWSETGEGWFKYLDKYGNEILITDKKGWSLKAGYFGNYDDGQLCYHAAYTKCWRLTQSFVVSQDIDYWKDCIEMIGDK